MTDRIIVVDITKRIKELEEENQRLQTEFEKLHNAFVAEAKAKDNLTLENQTFREALEQYASEDKLPDSFYAEFNKDSAEYWRNQFKKLNHATKKLCLVVRANNTQIKDALSTKEAMQFLIKFEAVENLLKPYSECYSEF